MWFESLGRVPCAPRKLLRLLAVKLEDFRLSNENRILPRPSAFTLCNPLPPFGTDFPTFGDSEFLKSGRRALAY